MSEMVPRRPPSRQDTPLPVVWYEFLLNPNLLQQHLSKDDPDPNAVQLMAHFLGNVCLQQSAQQLPPPVLGGQNTEFNFGNGIAAVQNNVTTNGVEKKRTKMLKSLALQTAAHLDWNLNTIQNNLPMHLGHGLLKDFLKCTEAPIDVPLESLDISDMYDPPALALITYHRWCIRLLVSESFPAKPTKPSTLQGLGLPEIGQTPPSVKDSIFKTIIDSLENSVLLLESILNIERTIALPSHVKIQQLANVSIDAQTEPMEKELEELIVNSVELHCQIAYDLGSLYFHHNKYLDAANKFSLVSQLLPMISDPVYCFIDLPKFTGYCAACRHFKDIPMTMPSSKSLHQEIEQSRRANYQGLVDLLIADNKARQTPITFRNSLEKEVLVSGSASLYFEVCTCNAIHHVLSGIPVPTVYTEMLQSISDQQWNFLFKTCWLCSEKGPKHEQKNIKTFLRDISCAYRHSWPLLCNSDVKQLFSDKEILEITKQQDIAQLALSAVTVKRQRTDEYTENRAVHIGQLEQELLSCNDPQRIMELLTELHRLVPGKRFSMICYKWYISKNYQFIIDGMGNVLTQDLVFIMLVKAEHCRQIKNYSAAKNLLEAGLMRVKDISFKLTKAIKQEILYVEILSENTTRINNEQKEDYIKRILSCMTTSPSDIAPREEILEQCIAFLLNTKSWSVVLDIHSKMAYADFGKLIANVCKDLPDIKASRIAARDLWDAVAAIFMAATHNKRGMQSSKGSKEIIPAIMNRGKFVHFLQQLTEPLCISVMLSCLAKLRNLIHDDIGTDVSSDYPTLWPTTVSNMSAINKDMVAMVTTELVHHILSVNSTHPSWLKTQADIHYADNQYAAALRFYLEAGVIVSDCFSHSVPRTLWNDKVYKRMIKCCSYLQCHTQAAILCQFLEHSDYTTAFKELQEKSCYDAMDALYEYIWDITILEFLVYNHNKHGEVDKQQKAMRCIGKPELNSFNPEVVLIQASQTRKNKFLQAMAKQYL